MKKPMVALLAVLLSAVLAACGARGSSPTVGSGLIPQSAVTPVPCPHIDSYMIGCLTIAPVANASVVWSGVDLCNKADGMTTTFAPWPNQFWTKYVNVSFSPSSVAPNPNGLFITTVTFTATSALQSTSIPNWTEAILITSDSCQWVPAEVIPNIKTGPPSPTPSPLPTCPPAATPGPNPIAPVPVLDQNGNPILSAPYNPGGVGEPLHRPNDGHDPEFFLDQGDKLGPIASVPFLPNFLGAGPWDEQRPLMNKANYNPAFVSYASVVIGLFGCTAGISEHTMLTYYNDGAMVMGSSWSPRLKRDPNFPRLPWHNTQNVHVGYQLCQSGTFLLCQPGTLAPASKFFKNVN